MENRKKINWGLVGASDIASTRMIPAINAQPDSQVVAVMSSNLERAKKYAANNNIARAYGSLDEFLKDPDLDVVYISTTNELHLSQTLAAAQAGKHVLAEKPLALTYDDAFKMIEACKKANVVMGTNHHLRNAVTHRKLRALIKEGAIGRPLAARVFHAVYLPPRLQGWRLTKPEAGGGVILDITVHDADTLRFILDDEVEDVIARSTEQGLASSGLEDAVMGVMYFRNGVTAQFHDAFTIPHAGTGLEIHGTEGSLFGESVMTQDPVGRIMLKRGSVIEEVNLDSPEDLYIRAVHLFNESVNGNGQPSATGEDGLKSLAVGLAALESSKTGRLVKVRHQ